MKTRSSLYAAALVAGAFSLFGSLSATAGVIITQSEEAPTENLLYRFVDETARLNWNGSSATNSSYWRDVGQTFKAEDNIRLSAFSLKLLAYGTQALNASITIQIYETGRSTDAFTTGTLISTQQTTLPASLVENQLITFAFDEAIDLAANKFYTIFLHFDEPGTTLVEGAARQLVFASGTTPGTNPLGTGASYWLRPSPFTSASRQAGSSLNISLYGEAIPEASAMIYLIGGGIALGAGRLWQRQPES